MALVDENARLASDNTSLVRQVEEQKQASVGRTSEPAVTASAYEGDIPTLIRSISSARGVDAEGMVELAFRESSFNPSATNGSCKGLFQLSGDYPDWADPVANTHNAITYILGRYGSVSAALAHHDAKGWY